LINNNEVKSQRVVAMTNKNSPDNVWEDIFNNLMITADPPPKYIKKVIVTTNSGDSIGMSSQDFSALLEYEKSLPPGQSDIQSARMSLDFNKIKKDVDKWAFNVLFGFDTVGKPTLPKFPKPKAGIPPTDNSKQKTLANTTKKRISRSKPD
jgi:hypothetical protein